MALSIIKDLKKRYYAICKEYVFYFSQKHEYVFSYWVGGEKGGIACFIDQYFFSTENIIFDVNTNQPKNQIFEWMDYCVERELPGLSYQEYIANLKKE